jgi:hypothetical protein
MIASGERWRYSRKSLLPVLHSCSSRESSGGIREAGKARRTCRGGQSSVRALSGGWMGQMKQHSTPKPPAYSVSTCQSTRQSSNGSIFGYGSAILRVAQPRPDEGHKARRLEQERRLGQTAASRCFVHRETPDALAFGLFHARCGG